MTCARLSGALPAKKNLIGGRAVEPFLGTTVREMFASCLCKRWYHHYRRYLRLQMLKLCL